MDTAKVTHRNLLMNLIEACLDDESRIVPLYDLFLQRQKAKPVVAKDSDFQNLGTVCAKVFEGFLTSWIVSNSDFTVDDLMAARAKWSNSA
eukprot:5527152-Lingulodinium_polyedra.AAC.1